MKLLPGTRITHEQALKHFRWLAVDENGDARVFCNKPVKVRNTWVPDEFNFNRTHYQVEGDFEDRSGELLRKNDNNKFVTHDG